MDVTPVILLSSFIGQENPVEIIPMIVITIVIVVVIITIYNGKKKLWWITRAGVKLQFLCPSHVHKERLNSNTP